jgi:hypothetical protein
VQVIKKKKKKKVEHLSSLMKQLDPFTSFSLFYESDIRNFYCCNRSSFLFLRKNLLDRPSDRISRISELFYFFEWKWKQTSYSECRGTRFLRIRVKRWTIAINTRIEIEMIWLMHVHSVCETGRRTVDFLKEWLLNKWNRYSLEVYVRVNDRSHQVNESEATGLSWLKNKGNK